MNTFDFDFWANLARTEPDICDILRRKLIDRQIRKNAKDSTELWKTRGWWTRVELDIKVYKSAIGRMICASKKMDLSLAKLNDQIRRFTE